MRTRALLVTAGVTTAVLVTAGVVAGQQTASAGTAHTLKATETITRTFAQDLGEKGISIGDTLAYNFVLKDVNGAKLGTGGGYCVVFAGTTETNAQYHCSGTYLLGGDEIFTGGMFTYAEKITKWPLLGGTGKYRGATGVLEATARSAESFADVFHFDS